MTDDPEAGPSGNIPLTQRHPTVPWALTRFHLLIDALRDMLDDLVPHVRELDDNRIGPEALGAIATLKKDQVERLADAMNEAFKSADEEQDVVVDEIGREWVRLDLAGTIEEIFGTNTYAAGQLAKGLERLRSGPSRPAILRNSLLTQAIAGFEVLVANLVSRFFVMFPDALGGEEASFSLKDLELFEDIDDAKDHLIAHRVDQLMYGDLESWVKWFTKYAKLDIPDIAIDYPALVEIFQRRHVITHNGARVSRQYLSKAPISGEPPKLGERLPVDNDYLRAAFDQLDTLATLLAAQAWCQWQPTERDKSAGLILSRMYELLLRERWASVEKLAQGGEKIECASALVLPMRCNGWLARKEQRGLDDIRDDVESWDVSALSARYVVVKLSLLGQHEQAIKLAWEVVPDQINEGEMLAWPILKETREHADFGPLRARLLGLVSPDSTDIETMDK